jgi:hypothetical protein
VANKYKLITGNARELNTQLEIEGTAGWVPILFSSTVPPLPHIPQGVAMVTTPPPQIIHSVILELREAPTK